MNAEEVGSIEELELIVMSDSSSCTEGIFITTSINEEIATLQLPVLYRYSSQIDVCTDYKTFSYRESSEEGPDYELLRTYVRAHSLELGLLAAKKFEKKKGPGVLIKVDELRISEAEKLFSLYIAEYERLKKEHENYTYE